MFRQEAVSNVCTDGIVISVWQKSANFSVVGSGQNVFSQAPLHGRGQIQPVRIQNGGSTRFQNKADGFRIFFRYGTDTGTNEESTECANGDICVTVHGPDHDFRRHGWSD